ncbi:Septum formation [Asanoa hainanensis]|uniref:Septum formation n=1 Tax=Asanoa hainanensis TaxID=560556 RepID=A0A239KCU0_9ACTN|nr:septum formation family protein [Asanoa hainanensis]SNT15941.1 Septum formation [Asanoa hainanensis]
MTEIHPQLLAKRRRRRVLIAAGVTALVVVLAGCLGVMWHVDQESLKRTDYRRAADSLFLGQCIKEFPDVEVLRNVTATDCGEPHEAQVVGIITLDRERSFPTDDELLGLQEDECAEELAKWAPAYADDETVVLGVLHPLRDGWDSGARSITCFASFTDGPRTGTLFR